VVAHRTLLISLHRVARGIGDSNKYSKNYEGVKDEQMMNVLKIYLHSNLYL